MQSKIVAIAAVAALAEQASAYNHNRHSHHVAKRAVETAWETVWETVYVTEGQEAPVATGPVVDPVLPIVTSTSVIVVPTTTQAPPAPPANEAPAPAPPAPSTTLLTSIAPKPTEEAPVVENPVVPEPEQPAQEEPKPVENPAVVEPEPQPEPQPSAEPEQPPKEETPAPSGGFSSKRGMAYNSAAMANSFHSACESCSWAYNWGSSASDLDSSVNYVPMLWGEKAFGHWTQDADAAIAAGAKALLSFNEPDHADQAHMEPSQAAIFHKEHMNPYKGKALIGSPAVTNGGGEMGLTWLKNFMAACKAQEGGCEIDFCAVHWYSEAQYADTLLTHIKEAHEICDGKPIWLTEFAPLGDAAAISDFMTKMIPQLEAIEYLDAYSYFWVDTSSLMSSESSLSSLGQIYATI